MSKKLLNKIGKLFKRYWIIILIVVVVISIGLTLFFKKGNGVETVTVKKSNFEQIVSTAGKVVPTQKVELNFNRSGRIERVNVSVGDKVNAGQVLASLDADEAVTALNDAKISLEKLLKPADLNDLLNKKNVLADAEESYQTILENLDKAYEDGLNKIDESFLTIPGIINNFDDLLYNYNSGFLNIENIRWLGDVAIELQTKTSNNFNLTKNTYDRVWDSYSILNRSSSRQLIKKQIEQNIDLVKKLSNALKNAQNTLDFIKNQSTSNSSYLADANSSITRVNSWLEETNSILNQLTTAQNLIITTERTLDSKKREIAQRKEDLINLEKGADQLDINSQLLNIEQKEKVLSDYFLRSPFSGLITKVDVEKGEISSVGTPAISLISDNIFQVESFVPEINIAKISIGNKALITLDAYGEKINFSAQVVGIDPAETIRDGVTTYKVILQFDNKDNRIKSGMTANIDIIVAEKKETIVLPPGAIIFKEGKNFVQIVEGKQTIERSVEIGNISALGQTEIISGLNVGEKVVLNPEIN